MGLNNIQLTERAARLYQELAGSIGRGALAFHVVWDVTGIDSPGVWTVGLTPEASFQTTDKKILDKIIAGRFGGILIVIDGPIAKPAPELRIRIDTNLKESSFTASID